MSIDTSDKLIAALQGLDAAQVAGLPPAERRRLVEALEQAHRAAKGATVMDAKAGVLADLKDGRGRQ
ncbi:MAG TPA: hypothetical protein VH913_14195 [Hyphomicrobiaceae bacterium]